MKILIYFSGDLSASKGTPIRTRNQIEQLVRAGLEVYYAGYSIPERLDPAHTCILRNPLLRALQLTRFIRSERIDILYIQTSAGIWYAPWIRLTTRAKVGLDFHSRRYQEEHVYRKRQAIFTRLLEQSELLLARSLHFATVVSQTLKTYYLNAIPRILVLPIGVDLQIFSPNITPREDIMDWKGNAVLIAYAGNTKWYQGIETVLAAFKNVAGDNRFKMLVIASSGVNEIRTFASENALEHMMYVLDSQPHERIPSLLAAADILTVVRPLDLVTEYSFPSKLPEYAALGKALVVSAVSDIGSYVQNGVSGLVVRPGDSQAVENAFERLLDSPYRDHLGHNARVMAERQFDLVYLGIKLADFIRSMR